MKKIKMSGVALRATFVLALLAVLALVLTSCFGGDISSREEIERALDAARGGEGASRNYVADYLSDFGISNIEKTKFKYAENIYYNYYDGELPEVRELAIKTTELFLEYFYDELHDGEKADVTDALIKCFVGATGDVYGVYRTASEYSSYVESASGEFVGIGVEVMQKYVEGTYKVESVTVTKIMKGSGAEEAGVAVGDLITHVEGKPVTDFDGDGLVFAIRGEIGSYIGITVSRGGEPISFNIERRKITESSVEYELLDGNVGYIAITAFKDNTPTQFKAALTYLRECGVSGILFDLRGNPGGGLQSVCDVISELIPAGTMITTYERGDTLLGTERATGGSGAIDIPIAVLCNKNTASAGELFTSAMRDYNELGILDAVIIGEVTYGKGVMQSGYYVLNGLSSDGSVMTLTIAHYNSPKGENYHGVGILPDVEILDTDGTSDWVEIARGELLDFIDECKFGSAAA